MGVGQVLPIPSPVRAANASWQVEFLAPGLKCESVNTTTHLRFRNNICAFHDQSFFTELYGYLAWSPGYGYWNEEATTDVPFLGAERSSNLTFRPVAPASDFIGGTAAFSANPDVFLYVVAMPSVLQASANKVYNTLGCRYGTAPPPWIDGAMLQCQAYTSRYRVSFVYGNGDPVINIDVSYLLTEPPIRPVMAILGPHPDHVEISGCDFANVLDAQRSKECYNAPGVLRTLSSQAVMDAFARNLVGSIYVGPIQSLMRNSSIMNTALLNTKELAFLQDPQIGGEYGGQFGRGSRTLQDAILTSKTTRDKGMLNTQSHSERQPLREALEQMFQNVVVSLMSSAALQPNYTSTTAPPPAEVTILTYQNIYVYAHWRLWLPYGIAILVTAIAALVGYIATFLNGVSYDSNNSFSTIFRVAKGAEISIGIDRDDLDGKAPLPEYLAKAQIWLGKDASNGRPLHNPATATYAQVDATTVLNESNASARLLDLRESQLGGAYHSGFR